MNLPSLSPGASWSMKVITTPDRKRIPAFFRADKGREYLEWAADVYQWLMLFEREFDADARAKK